MLHAFPKAMQKCPLEIAGDSESMKDANGLFDDSVKNLFKCDAKSVSIHKFPVRRAETLGARTRAQVGIERPKFILQFNYTTKCRLAIVIGLSPSSSS